MKQMKKKNCITISLGVLVLLVSVKVVFMHKKKETDDASVVYYSQFPQNFQLTGEGFVIENELMRYPYRIHQLGDYVYVLDLHGEDHFCHLFYKNNFKNVVSFAQRGNGPQEVLQALCMDVQSENSIWVFDTQKRNMIRWRYSVEQRNVIFEECIHIEDKGVHSANCTWGSDSLFFFTDGSGMSRILKCDIHGKILERIGVIPTEKEVDDSKKGALAQAWNGFVSYNPNRQLLVVVTQLGDVIEIYNLQNGTNKILRGPLGEPIYQITREGWAVPTGFMGYSDVEVTDNYIYAVFHGRSFKDIAKDPQGTPDGGEFIHVYNHEGVPVCRMILDCAIYGIDVDEKNGVIWATDVNSEEQIVKYQLPEMLKL